MCFLLLDFSINLNFSYIFLGLFLILLDWFLGVVQNFISSFNKSIWISFNLYFDRSIIQGFILVVLLGILLWLVFLIPLKIFVIVLSKWFPILILLFQW